MKKLWLLPCLAAALMAADVSGKWTGNVNVDDPTGGSTINTQVRAELRQKADAITGTIGRQEDQEAESIQNAKLDGKRLTFEVSSAETTGLVKFVPKTLAVDIITTAVCHIDLVGRRVDRREIGEEPNGYRVNDVIGGIGRASCRARVWIGVV